MSEASVVNEITELLEQQLELHKDLLNLSYEKRQVILKGDTARLNEIIQQEIIGLSGIDAQENKRNSLILQLSDLLSIPEQDVSIKNVLDIAQDEQRGRLTRVQKELGAILREQVELNKMNKQLLEAQIEFGEALLNVMVNPDDPLNNFYNGDGATNLDDRPGAGFFDAQI